MASRTGAFHWDQPQVTPVGECRIQIPEKNRVVDSKGQRNKVQTWDDFTQNTTIHGVKYIFDKGHFKLRRYDTIRGMPGIQASVPLFFF